MKNPFSFMQDFTVAVLEIELDHKLKSKPQTKEPEAKKQNFVMLSSF